MTPRAPKLCGDSSCGELVYGGQRYCEDHQAQHNWHTGPNIRSSRSHDAKWKRTARRILKRDGHRCQIRYVGICIGLASEVDHTIPVSQGGTDLDSNLRGACGPCHKAKSSDEGHIAAGHKPAARITYIPTELRGLPT
jgi:5-methylcytosine-specific restriction protein A